MRPPRTRSRVAVALLALAGFAALLATAPRLTAEDWPQFLGPHRDGSTTEPAGNVWPNTGPRVAWYREIGHGFSGAAVASNHVVIPHRRGGEEILDCFDAANGGTLIWHRSAPATYRDDFGFDDGPRATPAIADGRVFMLGAAGVVRAYDLQSGEPRWTVDLMKTFGAAKGYFGFACSPLVTDGLVLLNAGGTTDAGIVALEAATGKTRWKATGHEAGYASPVLAQLGGASRAVFFTREGLVVADPATGRIQVEHRWRSSQPTTVNAATPLVLGERIFLTASYGTGAGLFQFQNDRVAPVWTGDASLSSHYASVVHRNGLLFGFHGRQEQGASLRCVEAETGKVRWSEDDFGAGAVLLARDRLVILTERGELLVAPASGDGFQVLARGQACGTTTRAYPAIANGRVYVRDAQRLTCLDLGPAR